MTSIIQIIPGATPELVSRYLAPLAAAMLAHGEAELAKARKPQPCPIMAEIRKTLKLPGLTKEARVLLIMAFRAQRTRTQS